MLDPYFSGTKIEWLIREGGVPRDAAFGTIDSWLVFKLTGEHATDFSNASRTLLFDIRERWDPELCDLLGVDPVAARAVPERPRLRRDLRVRRLGSGGGASPATSRRRSAAELRAGLGKNTYGTGSFVLENAGADLPEPAEGLLTTIAWGVGDRVDYALEAAIFVTGAAVQWLRDQLGIIRTADETEELARSLDSNDGVYLVPAFTGLARRRTRTRAGRSWDSPAAPAEHLARAALEAMAYQTVDAVRAMERVGRRARGAEGGRRRGRERLAHEVPGGRARRAGRGAEVSETTALGAAYLAGVATGTWSEDVRAMWRQAALTSRRCRTTSASRCCGLGAGARRGVTKRIGPGRRAQVKPQVYKDPRPAEYFDRFDRQHAACGRTGCTSSSGCC